MLAYSCTTVDILMFATFRTTNLVVVVGGEVRWTKVLEIWIDPTLYLPQWINIEEFNTSQPLWILFALDLIMEILNNHHSREAFAI